MTAEEAVQLIHDGDHVAIGGTLYSRTPMALVFALLKSRRRHLTVSRPLACYEIELFLSTGALDRIVSSWVGIGLPWGLAPIFRHYVERGEVAYDEWSHLAMGLRYKAGAMGVPFLPTLTMLGSDLATRLDLQTVTCPYTGQRLAAVPALNPDVALIHAHRADMLGNVQVDGYQHMDVDMARAARTVIVSAEQIVSPDEIAERPDRTMLPHFAVDAVVAAPHGAYPHECYGRYGPDLRHFDAYAAAAKQDGPAAGLRYVQENADAGFARLPQSGRPGPPSRPGRRRGGADPAMSDVTAEELMAITASRLLADHKVVFAGVGMPLLASAVARHRHAPHLTIVLEGGIIGTTLLPGKLPISTNEMRAAYGAQMLTDITDIFLYAQRGYFDYGFLGAAQVDMYGNINTSVIGTMERPKVRLPGSGGANDIISLCNEVLIVTQHEPRRFVERVDFITSPGYLSGGDSRARAGLLTGRLGAVVTDLALLDFEPASRRMRLRALQPGVSVSQVRAQTGFELLLSDEITELAPPTPEEIVIYRELRDGPAAGQAVRRTSPRPDRVAAAEPA